MALTSDDLISMHKATTDVVTDTQIVNERLNSWLNEGEALDKAEVASMILTLNSAVQALAVVQRDLLKATLGG